MEITITNDALLLCDPRIRLVAVAFTGYRKVPSTDTLPVPLTPPAPSNPPLRPSLSDSTIKMLRSKVSRFEEEIGALTLDKSRMSAREDEVRGAAEAVKGRLDMLVVCLAGEFKFGGEVEEGLLGGEGGEVEFRASLRSMTEHWAGRDEEVRREVKDPMERIIEEQREEVRRVVTELGATHETRMVAEER